MSRPLTFVSGDQWSMYLRVHRATY